MPVSFEFLRGVIGFLGIGCMYMTGRTAVAVRKGWQKPGRLYGWIIRTVLCMTAVAFRHSLDTVDVLIWALAAAALSAAVWDASREKKQEDLTRTIFPDEK